MNEIETDELVAGIQALKSKRQPWHFQYLQQAHDGEPLLAIAKKMPAGQRLKRRKDAQKKVGTHGLVRAAPDRKSLVFLPEEAAPGRFARDLKGALGRVNALLKRSSILEVGASFDGEAEEDGAVDTLKLTRAEKMYEASKAKLGLPTTLATIPSVTRRAQAASREVGQQEYRVDNKYNALKEKLEELDGLKGKWFKGSEKRVLEGSIDGIRAELLGRRQQLQQAVLDDSVAFSDLKALHSALDEVERAVLEAQEAAEVLAAARASAATVAVQQAQATLNDAIGAREDRLKVLAGEDEGLREALREASAADAEAQRTSGEAMKAARTLAALESQDDPDPEALRLAKEAFDAAMELAEEAAEEAISKQEDRESAIATAAESDELLASALSGIEGGTAQIASAEEAEDEALDEAERLREAVATSQEIRTPKLVIEGISRSLFKSVVASLDPSDPSVQVDFDNQRISIAHDPLVFAQQNSSAVGLLRSEPPMSETPGTKSAQRFAAAFGLASYTDGVEESKTELHERGLEVRRSFDWEAREEEVTTEVMDELDDALSGKSGQELVEALLEDREGIVLGEDHSDMAAQEFLYDNLDHLKDQGVDTIYVEHIVREAQPLVDSWFSTDEPSCPAPLKKALLAIGVRDTAYPKNLIGVLEKAKARGLRVVGIDTSLAKKDMDPTVEDDLSERVSRMNALAMDTVVGDSGRKGKFVTLAGMAHNKKHSGDPLVPGIGDLLGVLPVKPKDGGGLCVDRPEQEEVI